MGSFASLRMTARRLLVSLLFLLLPATSFALSAPQTLAIAAGDNDARIAALNAAATAGVGQLAGTVVAALGLGVLNKFLEGMAGAVLAKIMVLVFIVIFIQRKPSGLFAMKGRSAEA